MRQHYASCPSVCLSVPYGLITWKQKNVQKPTVALTFPRTWVSGVPIFQTKRSKDKVTGCQKPPQLGVMFTYRRPIKHRQGQAPTANSAYAIARPNLQSYRRRLATGQTTTYHVSTQCQHTFLPVTTNTSCIVVVLVVAWVAAAVALGKKCHYHTVGW